MRPQIVKIVIPVLQLFVTTSVWSQEPPPPTPPPPPGLPIDDGLVYLLLLGLFTGLYFLLKKQRRL